MSTATSAYLNRPCRSLAEVLLSRAERVTTPPIGDTTAVHPISWPAIAGGSVSA